MIGQVIPMISGVQRCDDDGADGYRQRKLKVYIHNIDLMATVTRMGSGDSGGGDILAIRKL